MVIFQALYKEGEKATLAHAGATTTRSRTPALLNG